MNVQLSLGRKPANALERPIRAEQHTEETKGHGSIASQINFTEPDELFILLKHAVLIQTIL